MDSPRISFHLRSGIGGLLAFVREFFEEEEEGCAREEKQGKEKIGAQNREAINNEGNQSTGDSKKIDQQHGLSLSEA